VNGQLFVTFSQMASINFGKVHDVPIVVNNNCQLIFAIIIYRYSFCYIF
jgi:hypothetical protein